MNELIENSAVSVVELLGIVHIILAVTASIILLSIFVIGLVRLKQKKESSIYGWWLRSISIWIIIFGATSFTLYWANKWYSIYLLPTKDEIWSYWHMESLMRIYVYFINFTDLLDTFIAFRAT